jgi:hypothetical protein
LAAKRFLLDQNFPEPVFQVQELDARIEYVHLRQQFPDFSRVSTDDWILYLAADAAGFDGIVTRDSSQLGQEHELIALSCTRLTLVTWRHPIEDPVVEWGQLLAFSPQIVRAMDQRGPAIILLPAPHLTSDSFRVATNLGQTMASRHKVSYPELRSRAIKPMKEALANRKLPELRELLDRNPADVRPERFAKAVSRAEVVNPADLLRQEEPPPSRER